MPRKQPLGELAVRREMTGINLKSYDNVYYQYQSGFIDQESWAAFREMMFQALEARGDPYSMRRSYENNKPVWRASFQALLDEMIAEIDAEGE